MSIPETVGGDSCSRKGVKHIMILDIVHKIVTAAAAVVGIVKAIYDMIHGKRK